jgi:hypothetical protein
MALKPRDILRDMQGLEAGVVMTLSPGPIEIVCGANDARAAELLLWILGRWPDLKMGEMASTLNAAMWWSTFFATMPGAGKE